MRLNNANKELSVQSKGINIQITTGDVSMSTVKNNGGTSHRVREGMASKVGGCQEREYDFLTSRVRKYSGGSDQHA